MYVEDVNACPGTSATSMAPVHVGVYCEQPFIDAAYMYLSTGILTLSHRHADGTKVRYGQMRNTNPLPSAADTPLNISPHRNTADARDSK